MVSSPISFHIIKEVNMAVKIRTVVTYNLDGATTNFTIPFEYLARKFVVVTLIGTDRKELVLNQDYRFSSKTQITTSVAWGTSSGYTLIEIRRFTSATERLVDFADGSILRAYDLNISQVQTLHVAEEARDLTADTIGVNNDGQLDARGRRIVNLADPKDPLDAVNLRTIKNWNDGAYQSYLKAKTEAEKAAASATAAKNSQTAAATSQSAAKVSETNAKTSETNAKESERNALTYSNRANADAKDSQAAAAAAKVSETNAKTQADRSKAEADRAKGYADSMGNTIDIGKTIESINTTTNEVIWKGAQLSKEIGIGYPRVPGVASPATRFGYHNDAAQTPRMFMANESGGVTLTFPWETGTFATREWTNDRFFRAASNTVVLPPDKSKMALVVDNNNSGFYRGNAWMFRVDQNGYFYTNGGATIGGGVRVGNSEYSGLDIVQHTGRYFRIENTPHGGDSFANMMKREADGTITARLKLPQEIGMVATREWVNTNVNTATKKDVLYYTETAGGDLALMISNGLSRTPANHAFRYMRYVDRYKIEFYSRPF